jgi:hypothetical protein
MVVGSQGIRDGSGRADYLARSVLEPQLLEGVREANLAFLDFVAARTSRAQRTVAGLPVEMAEGVGQLSPAARQAVASLPYTLYDARFDDAVYWSRVATQEEGLSRAVDAEDLRFARTAVYLAWHLVRSGGLAPVLVLGMTPAVVALFRALPVSALEQAALLAVERIEARWAKHQRFWPRLLAGAGSSVRADAVRLLGLQLLAAESLAAEAVVRTD